MEHSVLRLIELSRDFTESRGLDFDAYVDSLFSSLDIENEVLMNMLISYHIEWTS